MSSTNKTSLGLNQWDATDPIQRVDFNKDNEMINEVLERKADRDYVDGQLAGKANKGSPEEYTLELLDGYETIPNHKSVYYRADTGMVHIDISVKRTDNELMKPGLLNIAQLPMGFRPSIIKHSAAYSRSPFAHALIHVSANGTVTLSTSVDALNLHGQISYFVAPTQ